MNKFFAAMLLAAVSIGTMQANSISKTNAIAVAPTVSELPQKGFSLPGDIKRVTNLDKSKLVRKVEKGNPATRTEAIAEDLEGLYSVTYTDFTQPLDISNYLIASSIGQIKEEESMPGTYTMAFPFLYVENNEPVYIAFEMPIYVEDNTIIIKSEKYNTEGGVMTLQVERYIEDGENAGFEKIEEMSAKFTGSGFSFDKDLMFSIVDEEDNYMFFYAAYISFQKSNATNKDMFSMGWKSLGIGLFQDGWLLSNATKGTQNEWCYEVEIQQSEIDENTYRILNPYGPNTPMAAQNDAVNLCGSIQFNMSDPDHIYFIATPTNFVSEQANISQFFATNTLSIYVEGLGWDVESAVEIMEGFDLWTTYKDGVLVVPSRYNAADDSYENDAMFTKPEMGLGVYPYFGSNWVGSNEKPLNMQAALLFPDVYEAGIEGVEIDSNAPVKYYNLQGVEVANPEKGQLLIKRQGGKAEKIVF